MRERKREEEDIRVRLLNSYSKVNEMGQWQRVLPKTRTRGRGLSTVRARRGQIESLKPYGQPDW